jgi:hypothetical protein
MKRKAVIEGIAGEICLGDRVVVVVVVVGKGIGVDTVHSTFAVAK